MKVTFWGTRGSIAKAGPSTVKYGGNTSCVEVQTDDGCLMVIDVGTGAHGLGLDLIERSGGEPVSGHLLITHTHWDHIQGLPFFAPLFQPGSTWDIYGPRGLGSSILDSLAGQMQYAYFPISMEQLVAKVQYHDLVDGSFEIGDATVTTQYLNHPALTLGYRIDADDASVVYAADHEPHDSSLGAGGDLLASASDARHLEFFRDADLLIHDAQYLATEYPAKIGWGHSPVEYVLDAGRLADVGRIALYHHDPTRTDDQLDVVVADARAAALAQGFSGEVFAAMERQTIALTGTRRPGDAPRAEAPAGRSPALDDLARSVLIAVGRDEIAATVREAAEADELSIWETTDAGEAVAIAKEQLPSIVVVDDDQDGFELASSIRGIDETYGADVSIVTVTGATAEPRTSGLAALTEILRWPFSAVYARTRMHASLLRRACRWQLPPRPADEDTRLASLQGLEILDTPPDERFDRLTKQASELLDVPIALVSLVDSDRQWFKSAHGLDASETSREVSFCAHAILGDGVFQIPDALADDRFAENPLVVDDPRVRFYAGVPLTLSNGSSVGTLCVIDFRPRLLDDDQLTKLRRLGDQVVEELEAPVEA